MKFLAMAAGIVSLLMKNAGRIRELWPALMRRSVAQWATLLGRFSIYLCMIDTPRAEAAARGAQFPPKQNLRVTSEGVQ